LNAKLLDHRYGKSLVRVLKVLRSGAAHTIKELSVAVSLEGDFEPTPPATTAKSCRRTR